MLKEVQLIYELLTIMTTKRDATVILSTIDELLDEDSPMMVVEHDESLSTLSQEVAELRDVKLVFENPCLIKVNGTLRQASDIDKHDFFIEADDLTPEDRGKYLTEVNKYLKLGRTVYGNSRN